MNECNNTSVVPFNETEHAKHANNEYLAVLIFPDVNRDYLNEYRLFSFLFKSIPNKLIKRRIEVEKAREWFLEKYGHLVTDNFYFDWSTDEDKNTKLGYFVYTLAPDLILFFDSTQRVVRFLFKKTSLTFINQLVDEIAAFKETADKKAEIFLLVLDNGSFNITKFELKQPEFTLEDNYNDDLLPVHQKILSRLNTDKDKGIVLLHGEPGTGKTSYIRYLTSITNKKVIFFPPNLAESITHPNLISVLIDNPNSILVIEDAENILLDRNHNDKSAVSALLNLSDGLLSDCLNIQIICTFNTDVAKIDSALLRKGRLIASYKFEALTPEKAQKLSAKKGFSNYIAKPMRLTDIYNQSEAKYTPQTKKRIGFKSN